MLCVDLEEWDCGWDGMEAQEEGIYVNIEMTEGRRRRGRQRMR